MSKPTGRPRGRPKGFDKERERLRLRELVMARFDEMITAQIDNACGVKFLRVRDKAGKFRPLTDEEWKTGATKNGNEIVEVYQHQPNVQAFSDLINRTIDKPSEQVQVDAKHSGGLIMRWEQ